MSDQGYRRTYQVDAARLHDAALAAAQELKYRVVEDNPERLALDTGISWRSWSGQRVGVDIAAAGEGSSTLTLSADIDRSGLAAIQIVDWGEGDKVVADFLEAVDRHAGAGG